MRSKILLTTLSLFLLSCKTKPDAYLCTFIAKDPIQNSYAYCVNSKTKDEKTVQVEQLHKWIITDPDSYEEFRAWYKSECGK